MAQALACVRRVGGFIHELRRRHVFKAGAAYLVSAWPILQLGANLLPTFDAPHWAQQALVGVLTWWLVARQAPGRCGRAGED